jgi:hypothetical protein
LPVSLRGLDNPTDREHVLAAPRCFRGACGCTALREGLRHKVHVRYLSLELATVCADGSIVEAI